jgi:hypothetical protein
MKKNAIGNKALNYTIYLRIAIKLLTQILNRLSDSESVADTKPLSEESTAETTDDTKQSVAEPASTDTYVKWPDARDQQKQWIPPMHGWLSHRSRNNWY